MREQVHSLNCHTKHLWEATITHATQSSQHLINSFNDGFFSPDRKPRRTHKSSSKGLPPSAIFVLVSVSLTAVIGQHFYYQPKLDIGTIAPSTIKAPKDATVIDQKTTEDQRRDVRVGAISMLKTDLAIEQQIYQNLDRTLKQGEELRQISGPFPFVIPSILSTTTQTQLRQMPEAQWQIIKSKLELNDNLSLESLNHQSINAWKELQATKKNQTKKQFDQLLEIIAQSRQRYNHAQDHLAKLSISEIGSIYDTSLLDLSDQNWQETKSDLKQITTRMLKQGISKGLEHSFWEQAIRFQVEETIPLLAQHFSIATLQRILEPNLVKDEDGTRHQVELAEQQVKPVIIFVKEGEVIVKQSEKITQKDFAVLDYFGLSARQINWIGLLGFFCLVTISVGFVFIIKRVFKPSLRRRDMLLLWLLALSSPLLVSLGLPLTSLPAVGLLVASFYGSAMAVTVVALLSVILPIGLNIEIMHLIASTAGGLVGGLIASKLRSREELAMLGVAVGLTQGIVYLIVTLIASATASAIWYATLGTVGLQALAGLAWSIVALGLSPYLEHLFDLITPIRLAELSNPNRPLLKRLAAEAPGTFQHTIFVASLAEAAAHHLGCNVELVRAGTLYHDIGKMHDPLAFIENQMGGPNKHDEIQDPWQSACLIKKHVSEGLVMAKKYRLPKAIQAFIPEHQGTMLIAYFYYEAQQIAAKENKELEAKLRSNSSNISLFLPNCVVLESDFRYPGPIPQSRETGIVMLADSCEAALRSLEDSTHEDALNMVNKILRARWQDNQLIESGLTRTDLALIAEIFVRVWEQFHHKRIAYPKAILSPR